MPAAVHTATFRVRHYECDAYGHLNNANYARYMQEAAFDASAAVGYGKDRYGSGQGKAGKLVPEGVEGMVPLKGFLGDFIYQLVGGLRSGMGYAGAHNLEELRTKTRLTRITHAGLIESHPHTITITREAPNYRKND